MKSFLPVLNWLDKALAPFDSDQAIMADLATKYPATVLHIETL